jgi:hypothetical protein
MFHNYINNTAQRKPPPASSNNDDSQKLHKPTKRFHVV